MIDTAVEDPERVTPGLVRLAQSHRQLCADFLRDHRDGLAGHSGRRQVCSAHPHV